MATHSSVPAWRIPGTAEPGGLPSMGSHRVGHDWSNLAAAAAFSPRLSWVVASPGEGTAGSAWDGPRGAHLWSPWAFPAAQGKGGAREGGARAAAGTLAVQVGPAVGQVPLQHPRALLLQVGLGPLHVDGLCLPLALGVLSCWVQRDPGWDFFVELDEVPAVISVHPERSTDLVIPELTAECSLKGVRPCALPPATP